MTDPEDVGGFPDGTLSDYDPTHPHAADGSTPTVLPLSQTHMETSPPFLSQRVVLLIACFLHMVEYSMLAPSMVEATVAIVQDSNPGISEEQAISESSIYLGYTAAIANTLLFFANPFWGTASDVFGRRHLILFAMAGLTLESLLMYLAPSLFIVILAAVVRGVSDVFFTLAFVTMTDLVPAKDFAVQFSKLGAAMGVGLIFGPVIAGVLSEQNVYLPFLCSTVVGTVNLCWWLIMGSESIPRTRHRVFDIKEANPFTALKLFTRGRYIFKIALAFLCGTCVLRVSSTRTLVVLVVCI